MFQWFPCAFFISNWIVFESGFFENGKVICAWFIHHLCIKLSRNSACFAQCLATLFIFTPKLESQCILTNWAVKERCSRLLRSEFDRFYFCSEENIHGFCFAIEINAIAKRSTLTRILFECWCGESCKNAEPISHRAILQFAKCLRMAEKKNDRIWWIFPFQCNSNR